MLVSIAPHSLQSLAHDTMRCMQVTKVVASELLERLEQLQGGLLGEDHSWV